MDQIICFAHPYYSGEEAPKLNCSSCCKIFIDQIKMKNEQALGYQDRNTAGEHLNFGMTSTFCPISM
jgi:hypothetical protein